MGIYTQAVQKLYVAYFSRPADVPGLEYWDRVVTTANGSTGAVTQAFAASTEYQAEFAGKDSIGIIDTIYKNLFGRTAEVAALAFWAGGLERKAFTISDAVTTIADAAQGSDKKAFANKVMAATAFTSELNTTAEILGYAGTKTNSALKLFIAGVTDDASLAKAIEPAALAAYVNLVVFGQPPAPPPPQLVIYDVTGLNKTFDADQLAAANKVIEFVANGPVGDAKVINVGGGSTVRTTGDMGATTLTLTHKAPGALGITIDADETAVADIAADHVAASFAATNATSLKLVFDVAFSAGIDGETTLGDNAVTLRVAGAASSATIVSGGGVAAQNILNYTDTSGTLTALAISGGNALTLATVGTAALSIVDAFALTAPMMVSTSILADGGVLKLGSGADVVSVAASSNEAGPEAVANFAKATLAAVGPIPEASAAAVANADVLSFGMAATVANANTSVVGATIVNGVLNFSGAGPSHLGEAIAIANVAAEMAGEVVLFEYVGRSYVFVQGADIVVQLVGTTGVTHLVEVGTTDAFFIV